MQVQHQVAIVGSALLVLGAVMLIRSVLRGRAACRDFEHSLPGEYLAHDSPMPGWFITARNNAYSLFLFRRQFETLSEPRLVALFEDIYRQDTMLMRFIFIGFGLLGVAFVAIEIFGWGGHG